jgi:hypothetical protein
MTQTPFIFRPEDEDKKIYVVKQEYIMTVEQYIKADNEEEAFNIFLTEVVDIDSPDIKIKYVGTVCRVSKDDPYDLVCEDVETEYKDNVVPFNKTFGRHA